MIEVKSPREPYTIFMAGSIEDNKAIDWQAQLANALINEDVILFNPRRDEWDSTWTNGSRELFEQIHWELDHLDSADLIVMYLDSNTISPISLLELGLYARSGKLIVCCGKSYFRYTNIEVICQRHGIYLVNDLIDIIEYIKGELVFL